MKQKAMYIGLMVMLCALMLLMGCSDKPAAGNPSATDTSSTTTTTQAILNIPTDPGYVESDTFIIETAYGQLRYPTQWKDTVQYTIDDSDPYTVSFAMLDSGETYPLFDVSFGGGGEFMLGVLPKDGEEVGVYLYSYTAETERMTAEAYTTWGSMCEDINVLIGGLIDQYGFETA